MTTLNTNPSCAEKTHNGTPFNRTFLFVPANHAYRVSKALAMNVDAVILDLEDAVAEVEKPAARASIRNTLESVRAGRAYVRCNALHTRHFYADLAAVVGPGLDGIVLPMLQRPADLEIVNWVIGQLERDRGLMEGSIDLVPILETATGLARAEDIAHTAACLGRVKRLALGAGDLSLDLGLTLTSDETELLPHRSRLTVVSRVACLEPPIDTAFGNVKDSDGCRKSAQRARELGFQGKICIHPAQCPIVEDAFAPSQEALARAEKAVAAFETAEKAGIASIASEGHLVDYPIYLQARKILLSQRT